MLTPRCVPCAVPGLVLLLASGCSSDHPAGHGSSGGHSQGDVSCTADPRVDGFSEGLEKDGVQGQLSFLLVASDPAPPAKDDNTFTLRVLDANRDVADVRLSVELSMPDHGHGSPTVPSISFDEAEQAFVVTPLDLFMAGVWRIDFKAWEREGDAPPLDQAGFFFCIEG